MSENSNLKEYELRTSEDITEEVSNLIEITGQRELSEEIERQAKLFKHLQNLLSKSSVVYDLVEHNYNVTYLWLTRYYEGKLPEKIYAERPVRYMPTNKSELEKMIMTDNHFTKIYSDKKTAERNIAIIEDAMWQLRQRPNHIKTIVEWRKYIEAGM